MRESDRERCVRNAGSIVLCAESLGTLKGEKEEALTRLAFTSPAPYSDMKHMNSSSLLCLCPWDQGTMD